LRPTPSLEDQVSVFISPSDRVDQLYPQALGFLRLAGLRWRYSDRPPNGKDFKCCLEQIHVSECETWRTEGFKYGLTDAGRTLLPPECDAFQGRKREFYGRNAIAAKTTGDAMLMSASEITAKRASTPAGK
jgi:hypothetical protein